jgi:hypothetical protein
MSAARRAQIGTSACAVATGMGNLCGCSSPSLPV